MRRMGTRELCGGRRGVASLSSAKTFFKEPKTL